MYLVLAYNYNIFLTLLNIYIRRYSNDIIKIELLNMNLYLMKLAIFISTFINTFDKDIYLDFLNKSKQNEEISNVLSFNIFDYLNSGFISILDKDYLMIYHHIISSLLFYLIKLNDYHHITLLTILLFQLTSPYMSLTRIFKQLNKKKMSLISFGLFGITFFICRIVYFTYLIYQCLFNEYYNTHKYYYLNTFLFLIYSLQIYWMKKIIKIYLLNK